MDQIADGLTFFAVFLLSTTLHEAAHAWAALKGGDPTAYHGGQVSLDPMPHIRREPIGMVVLPLLTAVTTGWPMGFASAPYDPDWARRYPRRAALMALAGPGANLLLLLVAAVLLRVGFHTGTFLAPESLSFGVLAEAASEGGIWHAAARVLGAFFSMNLVLFVFNLLPFPPLDGSAAITLLMSPETTRRYQDFIWGTPLLGFAGLFIAWKVMGPLFSPVFVAAANLLIPGVNYG